MLRKSRFLLLLLPCTLLLAACGTATSQENTQVKTPVAETTIEPPKKETASPTQPSQSTQPAPVEAGANKSFAYDISSKTFQQNKSKITYPVVESTDVDKTKRANELIKSEALKGLKYYEDAGADFSLDISYQVKLKGSKLVSIQYQGVGSVKGAAHPNNLFYTTTINVETGERVKLQDLVKIDESFATTLKSGKWKALKSEQSAALNAFSTAELMKRLLAADSLDSIGTDQQSDTFSYLTKDALGISLNVGHAAGDHAEFEIKFDELVQLHQIRQENWKDILSR